MLELTLGLVGLKFVPFTYILSLIFINSNLDQMLPMTKFTTTKSKL